MSIALLTDFGLSDPYVGVMKGVLDALAPGVPLLDVTHGVPPHDVRVGALFLDTAWPFFAPETVFLCVVDPGVGTARRPVVVRAADRWFVGPDNGLFSLLPAPDARAIVLTDAPRSRTFHGRDVFAPVAARIARTGVFEGPAVALAPLAMPDAGAVLYLDHFGNAITNLPGRDVGWVRVAGRRLRVVTTYGAADPGEAVALTGSTDRLEIAVRDGSAAVMLGLVRDQEVVWES